MLAPEFDKLNFELGQKYLAPQGYKYEKGNWHYLSDEWQLSFILGKDKNASYLQVKYLTVAIRHREVPRGDARVKLVPFEDIDRSSPVQISPFKLASFIESDFNSNNWKYVNARSNEGRNKNTYYPLYYGGQNKWIMKDSSFSKEENLEALKNSVALYGAKLITEQKSKELLCNAITEVAKYGVQWANFMTPEEIIRQIKSNGENWWVENEWINSYKSTFELPH